MTRLQQEMTDAIEAAGLKRRDVARHFRVSSQHVSHLLRGETPITEDQVTKLARRIRAVAQYGDAHGRGSAPAMAGR